MCGRRDGGGVCGGGLRLGGGAGAAAALQLEQIFFLEYMYESATVLGYPCGVVYQDNDKIMYQ